MTILPHALEEVIEALGMLPGVGPRTAERFAYYLLKSEPARSHKIAGTIQNLHQRIKLCPKTFALISADEDLSKLYTNASRDKTTIAVVAEPFDIVALEKTGLFKGTYHVLGGLISPIDSVGPEQLHIAELLQRITEDKVQEIILSTNASVEGESTALYINQQVSTLNSDVRITRLARGLPIGVDLEYADQITLGRALEGRTVV